MAKCSEGLPRVGLIKAGDANVAPGLFASKLAREEASSAIAINALRLRGAGGSDALATKRGHGGMGWGVVACAAYSEDPWSNTIFATAYSTLNTP